MLNTALTHLIEAGTDEAGRGCLAGPVTAAAVILPKNFGHPKLNDSKQLSELSRFELKELVEDKAVAFSVAHINPATIDEINILNASILAMHDALKQLQTQPQYIVVDGNRFKPFSDIPYTCVIKGDGKFQNIAAASVLAKTSRDIYMNELHKQYPMYNWKQNKGYPTKEHRKAIEKYGITEYHRKSFRLLPEQLKLEF